MVADAGRATMHSARINIVNGRIVILGTSTQDASPRHGGITFGNVVPVRRSGIRLARWFRNGTDRLQVATVGSARIPLTQRGKRLDFGHGRRQGSSRANGLECDLAVGAVTEGLVFRCAAAAQADGFAAAQVERV